MKLMTYRLGALLPTLLALSAPLSVAAAHAAPAAVPPPHDAGQISTFLAGFYGHHGPSDYDRDNRVSQVLKDRQRERADADVLLCAQGQPQDIAIGPVTVAETAGVGWATVTTHWDSGKADTFTAYVRLDSQPIYLDDVICAG
ncbi:hypothetical protein [Streptomyces sp. ISL-94]|uniref:hypothetical protein n=1 Tax=Streptomyces sp. ISL-94 TaxID=2819190 RepID=UPI001BEA0010|nr:hypothetical protein [Streptomyces sp. ISL-94]MBT2481782.1 hypothetical protein [Streptomyces sp. ISL-94]